MRRLSNDHRGFTLVELMITVVIVGILAAIAIPLYQANVKRAKAAEADAALGSIRTALRVYYAENGAYPVKTSATRVDSIGIDINSSDLTGKYFSISNYTYTGTTTTYTVKATNATLGIYRQIDQNGTLANFTP